jgi:multiple sugar transport system ATP-binding protein
VAVLSNGKLLQCASPRELYDNPVNQFVAGFIGSPAMNLLTAPLTDEGVRLAGTVIPLSAGVRAAAGRDRLTELVVGIRPEHLHLVAAAGSAEPAGGPAVGAGDHRELAGEILLVEELGADALMHVRLTGEGGSDDGTVVARTEGRTSPAPGQRVLFRVKPDDVFAFNPETGARLVG